MIRFVKFRGYKRFAFKKDQESSILALREKVGAHLGRSCEVVPEKSFVGEHGANGAVEGMIGHLTDLIRTQRDALEHRMGITLDQHSPITAWLVQFTAFP